jgi:hypothetical protein
LVHGQRFGVNTGLWSCNPHGVWLASRFGPAGRTVAESRGCYFCIAALQEWRIEKRRKIEKLALHHLRWKHLCIPAELFAP